ncbi:WD40 repeat-like protein [Glonium stellatum]|uniref:WD40 repeat-like protein n=1 Tax=Glonium stellatum TaxID=574774 RepID=A0A8E2F3N7_9PEZI|nr:WD40 repeat-like protein [Glonium stellatum]
MALELVQSGITDEDYILVDRVGRELDSDFQKDGIEAQWAEDFPKVWGCENEKIRYGQDSPIQAASFSDDETFLAVAVGRNIKMLCTETFQVVDTLRGTLQAPEYLVIYWQLDKDGKKGQPGDTSYDIKQAAATSATAAAGYLIRILEEVEQQHLFAKDAYFNGKLATFDATAFSHDGKKILYLKDYHDPTGLHRQAVAFDIANGKDDFTMEGHQDSIMSVVFSPDDKLIASAAWGGYLKIWDGKTGKHIRDFGPTGSQNRVAAFSPNSEYVVISVGRGELYMWAVIDPQAFPKSLGAFPGWPRTVKWSPDGEMLAAGSYNSKLMVFKPHRNAITQTWQVKGHNRNEINEVADVTWLQDGKKLAFKPGDGGLEIYDFEENLKWKWGPGSNDMWRQGF